MKKIIWILFLVFIGAQNQTLFAEDAQPVISIQRTDGGGSIWNLWGEYFSDVQEVHNYNTNVHSLGCTGSGRLDCRWKTQPPQPIECMAYNTLYDDMENYAGNQIELGNLNDSYSDIVNCQGDLYLRVVDWDAVDINNNSISITVKRYNVPF